MAGKHTRELAALLRSGTPLRLRAGTVQAVNADGTIDLTVAGDETVIEDLPVLGMAVTGAGVWLLQQGPVLLGLGSIGQPFLEIDAFAATDPLTDYPFGTTLMPISSGGWPVSFGLVETMRHDTDYNRQTITTMTGTGAPSFHVRRWIINSSAWTAWATL